MNSPFRSAELALTTRAAEGLERRRWSVEEIEAMTRAGVIDEDERFELIGGEIVPMSPKGFQHEVLKNALTFHWVRQMPRELHMATETTFHLSEDSFIEPDFIFFRRSDGLKNLNPRTGLFAVEVADSSLGWDLGRKSRLYASFGIPELWVINAIKRVTHVHRDPGSGGYASIEIVAESGTLTPLCSPALAASLKALDYV